MRVAVNAHLLSFGTSYRGAGISRYIRNLFWTLPRVAPDVAGTIFLGDRDVPADLRSVRGLRYRFSRLPTVRPAVRILWEQTVLPALLRRGGFDLLHSPGYAQPLLLGTRSVLTIHDLSFELFPGAFNTPNRLYLQRITRLSARRADRVVAVSEQTRRDAARLLGVPLSKIEAIPHGIEPEYRSIADRARLEAWRVERGLPERYILFFGTLEPRKNVETLVRAFARLRTMGLPHHLVIAGAKGWLFDRIFAVVEELGLGSLTHFPGYVAGAEQPLWYNRADLFAYPSLYEGFGFPPLEAMACGTPVVTSNTSSLPEVVGDAGLLVDPTDEAALAEAMASVLCDDDRRAGLVARGLARAAGFSWEAAAERTANLYRAILAPNGTA